MMVSACLERPKDNTHNIHTPLVRGPCPGLNTLANHGLLPRSGKNITQADLVTAMRQGVNQDESISVLLFRAAAQTNPAKDNVTFSLPDLGRHNILEHDASLRQVTLLKYQSSAPR